MVKVVWTDSAIEELGDIGEYISKDSERYAALTIKNLFESVDILEQHPRLGKVVPEFNNKRIRELIVGNYRIVYFIKSEVRLDILTVHNCARLLNNTIDISDID